MIGRVIQVMKVNQNAKKAPLVIKKWNACFGIMFNFWWSVKWSEWQKSTKMQKMAPSVIK